MMAETGSRRGGSYPGTYGKTSLPPGTLHRCGPDRRCRMLTAPGRRTGVPDSRTQEPR